MLILAALGGAFLMLLFLKVRGVIGFEGVSLSEFKWLHVFAAFVAGAIVAGIAHYLFGMLTPTLLPEAAKNGGSRDLRTVWGLAALPAAVTFAVFALLDVFIGGPDVYLTPRDGDSLVVGWSIGSLVLALAVTAWSLVIFYKGLSVIGGARVTRSVVITAVAGLCLAIGAVMTYGLLKSIEFLTELIKAVAK